MITRRGAIAGAIGCLAAPRPCAAEAPLLRPTVAIGDLPPELNRLPRNPRVIDLPAMGRETGKQGGTLYTLIGGQRDIRIVPIFSYARLMTYGPDLELRPDILAGFDVEKERRFTFISAKATAGPMALLSPPKTSAMSGKTSSPIPTFTRVVRRSK